MARAPAGRIDTNRLGAAVSHPGIDPRTWVANARVDVDPNAIVWDAQLGWLVDVTITSGSWAGEGPINCRVSTGMQGASSGACRPVRPDGAVVVIFPAGDPNEDAIIVGQLHDVDLNFAPSVVNGEPIVELGGSPGQVGADSTHITAAPLENLDQEWLNARITAVVQLILGSAQATQPFVRGTDLATALADFSTAAGNVVSALAVAPVAGAVVALPPPTLLLFTNAVTALQAASTNYLSVKILGD